MVSRSALLTWTFVVVAIALAYASTTATDRMYVPIAVLLGVGVLVPTILTERTGGGSRATE